MEWCCALYVGCPHGMHHSVLAHCAHPVMINQRAHGLQAMIRMDVRMERIDDSDPLLLPSPYSLHESRLFVSLS